MCLETHFSRGYGAKRLYLLLFVAMAKLLASSTRVKEPRLNLLGR